MNAMIHELEKLSTTDAVTKEQFQQLALIVLELARALETKKDGPGHPGLRNLPPERD